MGVAAAILVLAAIVALVVPGHVRELAATIACGMGCVVYALAVTVPTQLALFTVADAEKTADEQLEAPASKSGE